MLCENDSLYQLHRVQECLRDYPHVPSIDPYSHYPRGYRVPWLAPHSLLYATIAKLASVAPDDRDGLVALLSWVPPLLGLLSVLLAIAVAGYFTGNPACLLSVGALCAFEAEVVRPSSSAPSTITSSHT